MTGVQTCALPILIGYLSGGIIIGWAKPVPFNPYNLRDQKWGEALVAIAGPLANIALAIIFAIFIRVFSLQGLFLANYLVLINIVLAIFNLMPVPPLDGSKIFFALFPKRFQKIRAGIESYGLILVLIFIFFLWQFISPLANYIFSILV